MIESHYVYYDADYGSNVEKVDVQVGVKALDQEWYVTQLERMLHNRGVDTVRVNAAQLGNALASDTAGGIFSKGLVVVSGALPDTVYTGGPDDLLIRWIEAGGRLYWAGNMLGKYYSGPGGEVVPAVKNYQQIFFDASARLNGVETGPALSDTGNEYTQLLSLMNNRTKYGVSVDLPGSLAVGYTDGTYGSAVMVKLGNGVICVIAGDYSDGQRHDLAQIMASGIGPGSAISGYSGGDVKRGTVTGTVDVNFEPSRNYAVYIYFGGYFTTYGKTEFVMT
jgi:hypothetical protein